MARGYNLLCINSFNADVLPVVSLVEQHLTWDFRKNRIVGTHSYILTRMELGPTLTNNNFTCLDKLAAKTLHTQTLGVGITTIAGASATFLMCHFSFSLCNHVINFNQ